MTAMQNGITFNKIAFSYDTLSLNSYQNRFHQYYRLKMNVI